MNDKKIVSLVERFFEAFEKRLPEGDRGASHRAPMMSVEAFGLFCELKKLVLGEAEREDPEE